MRKDNCSVLAFVWVILLLASPFSHSRAGNDKQIVVAPIINEHHQYCLDLLKLALSYSDLDYNVESADTASSSQTRELRRLQDGQLDVIWLATSKEYEEKARPVRVPLYRGLLGYRIFVIRQGDQERFNNIDSLEDLRSIRLGQGADWADTFILEANNLNVVKSRKYENLFFMLAGERFDAFPRGVHEPWQELKTHQKLNLVVERNLALVYRMPMYFFVDNENVSLAKDIEQGLFKAIEDGSFERFFFNNQMIRDVLNKANLEKRKLFHLDNPYLPPGTPVDDNRLWWSPPQ